MMPRDGDSVATARRHSRGWLTCASPLREFFFARAVLVCLATTIFLAFPASGRAAQPKPPADPEDLRQLRNRIERLKTAIADNEETRTEARDALRESEQAISEANRQLHNLALERQAAQAELAQLNGETRRIDTELARRQETIGRLLSVRYLNGEADYLKLLLSGTDPNQTSRELYYYGFITKAQAELVQTLRTALDRIKELQEETRGKNADLRRIEASQKTERNRLAREHTARRGVLDKVSARLREQRRQVRGLERDESRLTRLIEEIGKVIAEEAQKSRTSPRGIPRKPRNDALPPPQGPEQGITRSFAALKGSLRLPVRGELTGRFGRARPDGGPSWKGLFIRAASGQEVRAVASGRVVFAEWMRGFGNLLILDHGEGYLTIYGNNEAVLKQVGDQVRSGDAVATTGASGGSTESGLYFEARHEGRPFDPLKWVALK